MLSIVLMTAELTAVCHLMLAVVMFYFARRTMRYLSQAWIMLIFGLLYSATFLTIYLDKTPDPGLLHPGMLINLMVCSYLQSIYPLGMALPGYLQWGRMWEYASPAIVLILIYAFGILTGSSFVILKDASDIGRYMLTGDVLLRFAALGLSAFYIINIFIIPHRLVRRLELPRDIIAYGTLVGLVSLLYVWLTINFSRSGYVAYMLAFTIANLALTLRVLLPVLDLMRLPAIQPIMAPPTDAELLASAEDDFNAENRLRFERTEYLMQHDKPFTDPQFNRDKLCRLTGLNRHLLLQVIRSQGYNDLHEYISRYRAGYLRTLIEAQPAAAPIPHEAAGFKTLKTAQAALLKYEGLSLGENKEEG